MLQPLDIKEPFFFSTSHCQKKQKNRKVCVNCSYKHFMHHYISNGGWCQNSLTPSAYGTSEEFYGPFGEACNQMFLQQGLLSFTFSALELFSDTALTDP